MTFHARLGYVTSQRVISWSNRDVCHSAFSYGQALRCVSSDREIRRQPPVNALTTNKTSRQIVVVSTCGLWRHTCQSFLDNQPQWFVNSVILRDDWLHLSAPHVIHRCNEGTPCQVSTPSGVDTGRQPLNPATPPGSPLGN